MGELLVAFFSFFAALYCIVLLVWGVLCVCQGIYNYALNVAIEEEERLKKE